MKQPVIFLAFADSRDDLPALQEERRALDDLLAEDFNVEQKDAATLERIEQTFRSYHREVRIFHFAGHANAQQISLVENAAGHSEGYVKGVAAYVGQQQGVELVFLNGCSTEGQVAFFKQAGIPCVIATTAPINDKVAREFAELFYSNFIRGRRSFEESFNEAEAQLMSRYEAYGSLLTRSLVWDEDEEAEKELERHSRRFPYRLHTVSETARQLTYEDLLAPEPGEAPVKIPPMAHLLLNREDHSEAFEDRVKESLLNRDDKPIACLVHGQESELPLKLCQRFREFTVRETFKAIDEVLDESRFDQFTIEMPRKNDFKRAHKAFDRIRESLKSELAMHHIPARDIRRMTAQDILNHLGNHLKVVLLQHNLYVQEWDPKGSPELIQQYLGEFWDITLSTESPVVVLLFSLQYPPSKGLLGRFRKPDQKATEAFSSVAEVLEALNSVPRIDLRKWNDTYASDDPGLTDRIFTRDKPLPMQVILPELEAIVRKQRQA